MQQAYFRFLLICFWAVFLTSCSQFVTEEDPPLPGKRVPILSWQEKIPLGIGPAGKIDTLPETWTNTLWPQTGGYPSHVMGHLSLPQKLSKAWERSIG